MAHFVPGMTGKTIGEAKRRLRDLLNLPADATATVNAESVRDDHVIGIGEKVEFSKEAGKKGLHDMVLLFLSCLGPKPPDHTSGSQAQSRIEISYSQSTVVQIDPLTNL